MPITRVSFVVRTYNEAAFLGRLLDVLDAQLGVTASREVIVVDSGSTDGTPDIARDRGVNLIEISKAAFDYSKALNLGIEQGDGDVIAILSAHAIPCTTDWLAVMLSHFEGDSVAGVYCRQVPWPGAYWREVVRIGRMFEASSRTFDSGNARGDVAFSNAASCIRRSVWQARPFNLPAAEDIEWATTVVADGHRIVYEARVAVYHSHNETPRQAAKRLIDLEKAADIQLSRHRSFILTARQSAGAAWRDAREIVRYTSSLPRRLQLGWDSVLRSFWFIRDFSRT